MLLKLSCATILFISLCEFASAAAVRNLKLQTTNTTFSLYAYGAGINGLPIIYGDGVAFIGNSAPPNVTKSTNITFTPGSANDTTWLASPNHSTWSSSPAFYINPSSGAFDSVGFANTTDKALPYGAVTSGFVFYGQSVMYKGSTGTLSANFWATQTDKVGMWILKWNSNGAARNGSVPVAIKSTPPVTITV